MTMTEYKCVMDKTEGFFYKMKDCGDRIKLVDEINDWTFNIQPSKLKYQYDLMEVPQSDYDAIMKFYELNGENVSKEVENIVEKYAV